MDTNTDQNTSPSKEKTEPTTAPASKDAKGAKNVNTTKSKKKAYKIVGGCVSASLLIACIGFASCNAGGSSKAEASATSTASAKAETLYANAKEVTLLDANGKETTDKITVAAVKKADATQASLKDWYFNHVVKGGYKYGILKFSDDSGKGIYADSTGIYEGELKEDTATKGYTKPADSDLIYTIDTSKKVLTKKASASASAEASASAVADGTSDDNGTSDSGDTASDNNSASGNTASNSGTASTNNSGSTSSNTSANSTKSSSSNTNSNSSSGNGSSSNSSKSNTQTCRTVHHDATGHYENVTSQQWVQDTAAYDEPVYTWMPRLVCKKCGYTTDNVDDMIIHASDEGSTYYNDPYQVQTGTVHHDATGHYETVVTGQQWVQDSAAYDETVCG